MTVEEAEDRERERRRRLAKSDAHVGPRVVADLVARDRAIATQRARNVIETGRT
jgi:hypothetical protein